MKTNFKTITAIIFAGLFCAYNAQGQTYGSGSMTNNCTTTAGTTGGNDFTNVGCGAGKSNQAGGTNNSFFGDSCGYSNTTGDDNTYVGYRAGKTSTTSGGNTMVGKDAGLKNTGGINTFIGGTSGDANTSGTENAFLGYSSGGSNISGSDNTFVGNSAGNANTTSGNITCVGANAGVLNTAADNVFVGAYSGDKNSSGTPNVCIGKDAGYYNATGSKNTICGYQAGYGVTGNSYSNNSFFGWHAGYANTTAIDNTFIGHGAGSATTSGDMNTFVGLDVGSGNTTGTDNTFIGACCTASSNTTGYENVAVGEAAGGTNTTGFDNTYLGTNADGGTNYSNSTAIGYGATVGNSNRIQMGNSAVTEFFIGTGALTGATNTLLYYNTGTGQVTKSGSSKRYKKNIVDLDINSSKIYDLRPVSFNFISDDAKSFGLIAEEVAAVIPDLAIFVPEKKVVKGSTSDKLIPDAVRYELLSVLLLKEMQKHESIIKEQQKKIDDLQAAVTKLQTVNHSNQNGEPEGKTGTTTQVELANNNQTILYQNEPNPFGNNTVIRYFIPENTSGTSYVAFYDMFGKEIKKMEVTAKGFGKIDANTENLAEGIYSYSLVVDGKVIDTKKMIRNSSTK